MISQGDGKSKKPSVVLGRNKNDGQVVRGNVMKKYSILSALCLFMLPIGTISAFPNFGANCSTSGCHTNFTSSNRLKLNTSTTLAVNPRLDGGSTASLPSYNTAPGQTVAITLSLDTTNGAFVFGANYAFAITGTGTSPISLSATTVRGIKNSTSNTLPFATSYTGWTKQGTNPIYFTTGPFPYDGSTNLSATFTFAVNVSTPPDVYTLTARVSGLESNTWTQSKEFLLNVTAIPEPGVLPLVGFGIVCLAAWQRRQGRG